MVKDYFDKHVEIYKKLDFDTFDIGINLIRETVLVEGKIFTCGNGGSALTASHFVTDWNKNITKISGKPFQGISLVDNIGMLTALANDSAYSDVFSGQLEPILSKKDLVVAISGSGNSLNVINAIRYANRKGAGTLAIVGYDGGELIKIAKHSILIPSFDMQLCEDIQLMFGHIVVKSLTEKTKII